MQSLLLDCLAYSIENDRSRTCDLKWQNASARDHLATATQKQAQSTRRPCSMYLWCTHLLSIKGGTNHAKRSPGRVWQRAEVPLVVQSSLCAAAQFSTAATELTRTCDLLIFRSIKQELNGLSIVSGRD